MASSPAPSTNGLQRAYFTLGTLTLVALILYFAQVVLIPLALAILLAFILSTPANWLEQRGLHRVPSVLIAAALGFAILGGVLYVAGLEVRGLANTMKDPQYKDNIKRVMQPLRGLIEQIEELERAGFNMAGDAPGAAKQEDAVPVVLQRPQHSSVLSWLPSLARPVLDLAA